MSFITKRERIFTEYDLVDLPPRNEGKLKAYASCTDARAWSHFSSDKTEHLVDVIKRNNHTCRPKYVPTDVIIDTLMYAKNAEIARLKHKIEEYEQMIAAFDHLDLTCEQKCEIAKAHAAIRAANKELEEMFLDLNTSNFTEGMDSDAFETGKSRGDEGDDAGHKRDSKSNQTESSIACVCEASTSAHDPRIEEMQEALINKDARLSAMQNTIAVMENDVCEPYCIYAHIYTALEKIYGTLQQNDTYKDYLNLLTADKDTRCVDIKAKILFKLKVLEKFCVALVAPCSQHKSQDYACFHTEVRTPMDTFALTSTESQKPTLDNKRAQLVADIMEHDEMKDILNADDVSVHTDHTDVIAFDNYSIDTENLLRLKNLQANYDELITCYENLKHEKECLQIRCNKYDELEKEFESLQNQLREYNSLWTEKEHYKKRSQDLDNLKEHFLVLSEETSSLETELKAESEINSIKTATIEDLRNENIALARKLNDATISFEKEKNILQCKLKETECTVMCQEQQIKSLSAQIDRLLEQDYDKIPHKEDDPRESIILIDEINALKDQIKNLKDTLCCTEEEKQQMHDEYTNKLKTINELKLEIEDWKSTYEKTLQRSNYLEKYAESVQDELRSLLEENRSLKQDVLDKNTAVENLINMMDNKSHEIHSLMNELDQKRNENEAIYNELREMRDMYDQNISTLENKNRQTLSSLQLARQESQELLAKVKDYDVIIHDREDIQKSLEAQQEDYNDLKSILRNTIEENKKLQNNNSILLQDIQKLRKFNNYAIENINNLQGEKKQYRTSLELNKKESKILEEECDNVREELKIIKESYGKLLEEKSQLEDELRAKKYELDNAIQSIELTEKKSEELSGKLKQSENLRDDLKILNEAYYKLTIEKQLLEKDLKNNSEQLQILARENEKLWEKSKTCNDLEQKLLLLKKENLEMEVEKNILQNDFDNKTEEINHLCNTLESKIEENRDMCEEIKQLKLGHINAKNNIQALQDESLNNQKLLEAIKKESAALIDKIKHYEALENEFGKLKQANQQIIQEKEKLQDELHNQLISLKKLQKDNQEYNSQIQNLLLHNEDLETALMGARNELASNSTSPQASIIDIMKEIEEMKREKQQSHGKIRQLLDKIDESENIISNLSEDILARDDKITVLENHINALEEEVRRLHANLAEVVEASEEIRDNSYEKINQSLTKLEAHHSKAAHNMKMELAKLQNDKAKLEAQLSSTKIKTEESFRDRHKYISQIIHLENERELLVTDIKQLELSCVGDTPLIPNDCNLEDILASLGRIRKSLEAKHSKSTSLEQTLLKVQTSSQLLLSKADEAKKIVEIEKQKIINEKEEAISEKIAMEKQLKELTKRLEEQTKHNNNVIKDLEAEILNQKLIIDMINESTQKYIDKLKDELQNFQNLYQNASTKANELQNQLQDTSEENKRKQEIIQQTNESLQQKLNEIAILQKDLESLNKPKASCEVQVDLEVHKKTNALCQTDKNQLRNEYDKISDDTVDRNIADIKTTSNIPDITFKKSNKKDLIPKQTTEPVNEVQILTANVEPTFDFVRNNYLNYKLNRLSHGRLELYSVPSLENRINSTDVTSLTPTETMFYPSSGNQTENTLGVTFEDRGLEDIYNGESVNTTSSKLIQNKNVVSLTNLGKSQRSTRSSGFSGLGLTNDFIDSDINAQKYRESLEYMATMSDKSTDKDLFVIYQDSDSSQADKPIHNRLGWQTHGQDIMVETVTLQPFQKGKRKHNIKNVKDNTVKKIDEDEEKVKLSITLPRVEEDTLSFKTSVSEKKSETDSFTMTIGSHDQTINVIEKSKRRNNETKSLYLAESYDDNITELYSYDENIIRNDKSSKSYIDEEQTIERDDNNTSIKKSDSHHELPRVPADFILIKKKNSLIETKNHQNNDIQKPGEFGLNYILDTVQREMNPNNTVNYDSGKLLRKTKSNEIFSQTENTSELSSIKQTIAQLLSNEYKSKHKSENSSKSKLTHEQDKTTKQDSNIDYEHRIQSLSIALEKVEKDYKKKIDAIKMQYDNNIKNIINEHNQGVKSIQSLHEETLQDIIKIHENEVENLRSMSIEALRKVEKLEKENKTLRIRLNESCSCLDEEPTRIPSPEAKSRKNKSRGDTKMLSKTKVEAFNVKPKARNQGPCTCSIDINVSDTIRNIFEQVNVEQRKLAEHAYLKYIANKILNANVESLDAQELSFLHFKVCRTWKTKLSKEEALQKRIDSLETELLNKQRNAQQHMAELDRKVAEERRRLQEVRDAVCRNATAESQASSEDPRFTIDPPTPVDPCITTNPRVVPPTRPTTATNVDEYVRGCNTGTCTLSENHSSTGLSIKVSNSMLRYKKIRTESNRAVLAKLDVEEQREKKLYNDEPPTRLRRAHQRPRKK